MAIEEKRNALSDDNLHEVSGGLIDNVGGYKKYAVINEQTGDIVGTYHTKKNALKKDESVNKAYRKQSFQARLKY